MSYTRQRILEYIRSQMAATPADVARAMHITPANARHHIAVLERQGFISVIGTRQAVSRGRPSRLYGPSVSSLGDNLDILANALMKEYLSLTQDREHSEAITELAMNIINSLSTGDHLPTVNVEAAGSSLTQRLARAVVLLNKLKYHARWEAHAEAPRVILGHCPYAAIVNQNPVLCQVDLAILEITVGGKFHQLEKLARDTRGLKHCIFSMA